MRNRVLFLMFVILGCGKIPCHAVLSEPHEDWRNLPIFSLPPFERAVRCIKYYEQLHTPKNYPYVGYGHKIQPGEKYDYSMSELQADSLLRSDLLQLCAMFRSYERDSLLLATLSYQIGPSKLLGNSKYPKSVLLKKLDKGDRNIKADYIQFSHWNGKYIPSIRRRRMTELRLLLEKCN